MLIGSWFIGRFQETGLVYAFHFKQARMTENTNLEKDFRSPREEIPGASTPEKRVLLSWSSGKDCTWALKVLRAAPRVEVVGLLTTVNTTHDRVAMHATRRSILEAQAASVGLPLHVVGLPWPCPNGVYEERMREAVAAAHERGVTHIAFGDLFLEDIREYRISQMRETGIGTLFPLWGESTDRLARRMIETGMEAVVTCVDLARLPRSFVGRRFDHAFLDDLPTGIDPCGENGEFHTCVLAGPGFGGRIGAAVGEIVERDGFCFADLALESA